MQAVPFRGLISRGCLLTRQSALPPQLSQQLPLIRNISVWSGDEESLHGSQFLSVASPEVHSKKIQCFSAQNCLRKPESGTRNPVYCEHIQLQDHQVQSETDSGVKNIAQQDWNDQAVMAVQNRWELMSSQAQKLLRTSKNFSLAKQETVQTRSYSTTSSHVPLLLTQPIRLCTATNMRIPERMTSVSREQPYGTWRSGEVTLKKKWNLLRLVQKRHSSSKDTVEKKLLHLMDMWEVEDAVALLRQSVEEGVLPHLNVVLNLQQQLANLGEVECLMNLHDFLKEHNLTSDATFFHCLHEAYYNSGRISEGVAVLRLLYHRTRKFSDVDVYFTLLTVMVLRHFPSHIELILSFVEDLKEAEVPVLEPEASLWKCYMMTEKWSEADNLLLSNEELRPLIPQQVARLCQGVDKAQFDQVLVLSQLLDLPFVRQRLRVLVAETLMSRLISEEKWHKLLKSLKRIKSLDLPLHADKLSPALDKLQRYLSPQYDGQVEELRLWCESLQEGGGQ